MKAIAARRSIPPIEREFDIALRRVHQELEKLFALWKGLMFNGSNERVDEKGMRRGGTTRERKCSRYEKLYQPPAMEGLPSLLGEILTTSYCDSSTSWYRALAVDTVDN